MLGVKCINMFIVESCIWSSFIAGIIAIWINFDSQTTKEEETEMVHSTIHLPNQPAKDTMQEWVGDILGRNSESKCLIQCLLSLSLLSLTAILSLSVQPLSSRASAPHRGTIAKGCLWCGVLAREMDCALIQTSRLPIWHPTCNKILQ